MTRAIVLLSLLAPSFEDASADLESSSDHQDQAEQSASPGQDQTGQVGSDAEAQGGESEMLGPAFSPEANANLDAIERALANPER